MTKALFFEAPLTLGVTSISDKDEYGGNTAALGSQTGPLVKEERHVEQMQSTLVKSVMGNYISKQCLLYSTLSFS